MSETVEQRTNQERVFAICNDIYAGGSKPSVRMVLSMLPDINSTSTVHKYFALWKKELEASQQSLYDKLGFSTEFSQSFMKEITRFGVEAEQRYKEQARDADEQRIQALEDLERSEDRLYKQTSLLNQKDKEIKELQTELIKVQEQLKAQLANEQAAHKLVVGELRQQLTALDSDNKALLSSNELLRTEIAKAELRLEGNEALVSDVKERNVQLVDDNKALNKEIAEQAKKLASSESTISGHEKLILQLQSTQDQLQSRMAKIEDESSAVRAERNELRRDYDITTKALTEVKEKLAEERGVTTELKRTIEQNSSVIAKLSGSNKGK
jgi:chromosome segregation ATPase